MNDEMELNFFGNNILKQMYEVYGAVYTFYCLINHQNKSRW